MIEALTVSAVAVAFGVNILSSLLKKFVYPRFGKLGVQTVVFVLSAVGAWFVIYGQNIESIAAFVAGALGIFSLAVTIYEVILSRLDIFKVTTAKVQKARAEARG